MSFTICMSIPVYETFNPFFRKRLLLLFKQTIKKRKVCSCRASCTHRNSQVHAYANISLCFEVAFWVELLKLPKKTQKQNKTKRTFLSTDDKKYFMGIQAIHKLCVCTCLCVCACVCVCVCVCVCMCCLLYTSPSPRDSGISRMPSSA